MHFAEFGVVLLLFLVGLELEPSRLWALRQPGVRTRRRAGAGDGVVLGRRRALALGLAWQAAMVVGFGLAMSSTAIVLASLGEREQLDAARRARGVRDPAVPGPGGHPADRVAAAAGAGRGGAAKRTGSLARQGLGAIAAVIVGSRLLVRPGAASSSRARRPRGVHRGGAARRGRDGAGDGARSACRCRSARSSPACCSPTPSSGTSSRPTSSRSRDCCSGLFFIAVGMSANLGLLAAQPLAGARRGARR